MTQHAREARTSKVGSLSVVSMDNTCVVEIGDSERLVPLSRALAVQRERAVYRLDEFRIDDYGLFRRIVSHPAATERIRLLRNNPMPEIRVGNIRIIAMSSSCIVQLGSGSHLHAEARVKNIRHLFNEGSARQGKER